jgi:hypothetical protein
MWPHTGFPRQKLFPSIVEILLITGEDVEFRASPPLVTALDAAQRKSQM